MNNPENDTQRRKAFLETSVQIEKSFGYDSPKVLQAIDGKELLSSRFVLAEYKRSLIKDAAYLYAIVKQERSPEDARKRLARERSNRIMSRCLEILAAIVAERLFEKQQILLRLERYLDWQLLAMFEDGVQYLPDEIGCYIADEEPSLQNGTYFLNTECTLEMCKCSLPRFVQNRRPEFQTISDYVESNKSVKTKIPKVADRLSQVLENQSRARGNNCKTLTDCTISVECPNNATLHTTDRHYDWICQDALGKSVKRIQLTKFKKLRGKSKPEGK